MIDWTRHLNYDAYIRCIFVLALLMGADQNRPPAVKSPVQLDTASAWPAMLMLVQSCTYLACMSACNFEHPCWLYAHLLNGLSHTAKCLTGGCQFSHHADDHVKHKGIEAETSMAMTDLP